MTLLGSRIGWDFAIKAAFLGYLGWLTILRNLKCYVTVTAMQLLHLLVYIPKFSLVLIVIEWLGKLCRHARGLAELCHNGVKTLGIIGCTIKLSLLWFTTRINIGPIIINRIINPIPWRQQQRNYRTKKDSHIMYLIWTLDRLLPVRALSTWLSLWIIYYALLTKSCGKFRCKGTHIS
jgi:hypothetical protein